MGNQLSSFEDEGGVIPYDAPCLPALVADVVVNEKKYKLLVSPCLPGDLIDTDCPSSRTCHCIRSICMRWFNNFKDAPPAIAHVLDAGADIDHDQMGPIMQLMNQTRKTNQVRLTTDWGSPARYCYMLMRPVVPVTHDVLCQNLPSIMPMLQSIVYCGHGYCHGNLTYHCIRQFGKRFVVANWARAKKDRTDNKYRCHDGVTFLLSLAKDETDEDKKSAIINAISPEPTSTVALREIVDSNELEGIPAAYHHAWWINVPEGWAGLIDRASAFALPA